MNYKVIDDKQYSQPPPAYTFNSGEVPPPPGYTQQYEPPHGKTEQGLKKCPPDTVQSQPCMVLQPPPMGPQPRSYFLFGVFTMICCNFILGALAVWMSCRSQHSSDLGDYVTAKKKGRCSLAFSIASILLGLATLTGVICFYLYRAGVFDG